MEVLIFLYLISLDVKKDYDVNCRVCHKSASEFFKNVKSKDLYNSVKGMYINQVGVVPSDKRIKNMLNYSLTFKKSEVKR